MKRRLFTIAMFSLVLGGILTSCNSPQEKATDAREDFVQAKGNIMDPVYAQQIVDLEHKNTAMQNRIDDYEKYNSSWEEFKRDFTREMDELGESLKGVGSDNSK